MHKALLLSNNELLSDIYSVNLRSYLDIELDIVDGLTDAIKLIEKNSYAIVISLSIIEKTDVAVEIFNKIETQKIPLVVVGEKSEISNTPDVITIPGNLNVKYFLRSIAKILGITAHDMAAKSVGTYFSIGLKTFLGLETAPCDIFYKVSKPGQDDEFSKIWIEGQPIGEKIEKFKELAAFGLFVESDKRLFVTKLVTRSISKRINDKGLDNVEKLEAVESGFELIAHNLFSNEELAQEAIEISGQCISAINEVIKDDPTLSGLLLSLASNKSRFIYMHSVLNNLVCQFILREIPWGSKEHIDKVKYVLFFHDMYLVPVYNDHPDIKYEEDLIFSSELTDIEKDMVINHAKDVGNALKQLPNSPMGADTIVTQHHGASNGLGFNMNPGDDISPLAKVIIVGEAFVDEFLKAKDDGISPNTEVILAGLTERFANKSYQKIVATLKKLKI